MLSGKTKFYMVPNWTSIMSIENIIMRTLYYKIRTYFLGIKIEKANGSPCTSISNHVALQYNIIYDY